MLHGRQCGELEDVVENFASDTAGTHPLADDNCTNTWLQVMLEVITATVGDIGMPRQPNGLALNQKMGAAMRIVLQGPALLCAKGRDSALFATTMRQVLAHASMDKQIKKLLSHVRRGPLCQDHLHHALLSRSPSPRGALLAGSSAVLNTNL